MADYGEKAADNAQKAIEKRLRAVYQSAYAELKEEFANFVERSRKADERKRKQKEAGIISEDEYADWQAGQKFIGEQWKAKMDHASDILLRANQEAMNIVNEEKINVFAENANYAAYELEKEANLAFGFGIYDADAVGRLLREQPELLPRKVVNGRKDKAWNQRKIANCVAQGIIQGDSIEKIANRIAKQTSNSNYKAMTRYARTAVTGAQNAGRLETMHRAQGMGINVKKKWLATLDSRTRDSHARLDGQVQDVDKPFKSIFGDIMYPGDLEAEPGDVWNCRCTLEYVYPDFSGFEENAERYDQESGTKIEDMTYHEWTIFKQNSNKNNDSKTKHIIASGTDITGTWTRRADQFDFEIEDVINAQGFDGVPRVVDPDEFDKAVHESGFVAQRTYSAPDQKTLDAYREQLYKGKWYVDCSTGGAQYGQGMYCAADYNGTITDGMRKEMAHYIELQDTRLGYSSGHAPYYVETLTLDPSAKIITYKELSNMMSGYVSSDEQTAIKHDTFEELIKGKPEEIAIYYKGLAGMIPRGSEEEKRYDEIWEKVGDLPKEERREIREEYNRIFLEQVEKSQRRIKELQEERSAVAEKLRSYEDEGSAAAALGYDAIDAEGHGASGSYTVVLNRTKCIFLGGNK